MKVSGPYIALATLLLVFGTVEIVLRVSGYAPLARLRGNDLWKFLRVSDDPVLTYELVPGARGFCFGADIAVNSRGFRDREYALPKPAGSKRVVVLGDSIAFGYDLAIEDTFPERIEARFAAAERSIEVCNLGVTGYDTLQMARSLERVGLELEPDLVVVGFCFNDLGMASVELAQFELARRYDTLPFRLRLAQWWAERYERRAAVRSYHERNAEELFRQENAPYLAALDGDPRLKRLMQSITDGIAESERKPSAWSPLPWYASPGHVGKFRYALGELERLAREGGFPVLFLILPYLKERPCLAAHDAAYQLIAHEAQRRGFDVLDVIAEVRTAGASTLQVRASDAIHYNSAGHALIAEKLGTYLLTSGLLD